MIIKLKCKDCGNELELDESEFKYHAHCYRFCEFCGGEMTVKNIGEVVEQYIQLKINENINKWISELGMEGTIELIERNNTETIKKLYIEELKKRGFKVKEV